MTNAWQAIAALGDPTRREIFERLAERPSSVGALAERLPVSSAGGVPAPARAEGGRPGERHPRGTRRIYRLDPRGIGAMRDWLDQQWDRALAAFKDLVETPEELTK